ncbi:MAG: DUF962 domain-containing protein [Myxococcales bacterium]|nr:DUF962 domain-containing protein [Myxococcales bacterium]
MLPRPQRSLRDYLAQYEKEHTQLGTKLTHMVGIPMIVASIPATFVSPPLASGLFVGGWALQFIGHAVFEKNKPAFFGDPYYLLVGPVWVTAEWMRLFGLPLPEILRSEAEAPGADAGAGHHAADGTNRANGGAVPSAS